MASLIGRTIDRYELVERLGRGSMAAVYKAYQKSLKRYVAIKILHPEVANDETFRARFQREGRSVANLRHPNIVQVHDFGTEAGFSFLVMEYVEGPSLKRRLKTLRDAGQLMPYAETLHIAQGVASALDHAHGRGIVHRDIKPGNIMLTAEEEGDAILTDFGLIHLLGMSSLTSSGILGTPEYIAPEQGEETKIDARSDLYSLGIVLYEMLTGKTPFEGETPLGMILKHIQGDLPAPSAFNPDLPVEVEHVVMRAVARAPDDRFQHAMDFSLALTQVMEPLLASSPPVSPQLSATVPYRPTPTPSRQSFPRGHIQLIDREELRQAVRTPPDDADLTSAGPSPELQLLVIQGAQQGLSVPLVGRIALGRAAGNTLALTDARISRRHASIEVDGDQIRLTDLGSTNGTFVNKQRVSVAYLREGDSIELGDVTLLVQKP